MFFILKILNLAAFISFAAHITQSGHLGLQRDLSESSVLLLSTASAWLREKEMLRKMQVFQRTLNHTSHFRWVRAEQIHAFANALLSSSLLWAGGKSCSPAGGIGVRAELV